MLNSLCEGWFVRYLYLIFFDWIMHIIFFLISVLAHIVHAETLPTSKCSEKLDPASRKDHCFLAYVTVF